MSQPPADLDTEHQPPMALPFAHFVVGTILLVLGGVIAGLGPLVISIRPDNAGIVHLLLVGWVAVTIMGAMTLFVPVWSGTNLRSHRSAVLSLWLVVVGVLGLVWAFLARDYGRLPVGATVLLAGFWLFVSNVGRSLPRLRDLDVTEAHFVVALASLAIASLLGWILAAGIGGLRLPISYADPSGLLLAHLTFMVFGFVLATIVGALYQLSEMFTQSPRNYIDDHLTHVEMVALPIGIVTLAAGRYVGARVLARFGATLLLLGTACFGVFLLRRLWLARVSYGPMLKRYALVAVSLIGWVLLSLPRWIADPLDYFARFGSPRGTHLLFVGIVAFTIVGTFYHVVPFVVWYNEYRDKLGLESVPMMEDLYDKRVAKIEFWLLTGGFLLLVGAEVFDAATWVRLVGGNVLGIGFLLFAANMAGVVIRHRPQTFEEIPSILVGRRQ